MIPPARAFRQEPPLQGNARGTFARLPMRRVAPYPVPKWPPGEGILAQPLQGQLLLYRDEVGVDRPGYRDLADDHVRVLKAVAREGANDLTARRRT